MEVKEDLIALRNELFDFTKRNPFVHINPNILWDPKREELDTKVPDKLYKKAKFYFAEYGLETTLKVTLFIKWALPVEQGGKKKQFLTSPLFYKPCKIIRHRKIDTSYTIDVTEERVTVNPILRHYFRQFFGLKLPTQFEDQSEGVDLIMDFFNAPVTPTAIVDEKLSLCDDFNDTEVWQLITNTAIGNFNYKKSALGADYDFIIESPNNQINELLSNQKGSIPEKDALVPNLISPLDHSQKGVLKNALNINTVIQGPPGTGKSHTIVALVGAFLAANKRVLFVSEKRSALEVVNQRLAEIGLGNLMAYFNTDKDQKKAFYAGLKNAWATLNEPRAKVVIDSEPQVVKNELLNYYPEKLNRYNPKLEGNLNDLIKVVLTSKKVPSQLKVEGKVPSFANWQKALITLVPFEKAILEPFQSKVIGTCDFIQLNTAVFSEAEPVLLLEKRLTDLENVVAKVAEVQKVFLLNESFDSFVKLALTASILTMVDKVQIDLLNTDSKKYKSFNAWAKKYQLLKNRLKQAELANKTWKQKPVIAEITELLDLLSAADRPRKGGSIIRMLKRNPAKLKTVFKDFHPGITTHTKVKLLESVKLEWRLKGELDEVIVKLKHNLNIVDPENEIDLIFNLRNKLDAVSQNEYLKILEHEKSRELIHALSNIHPQLVKFNSQNRFLFQSHEIVSILEFEEKIKRLKKQLPQINHWLPELKQFFKLPADVRLFVQMNPCSVQELNARAAYQNLLEETRFDPVFKELSGWELLKQVNTQNKLNGQLYKSNVRTIVSNAKASFIKNEGLVSTPNFKLREDQKIAKKQFKEHKRLILHEINKQQRHLSVKSFFEQTVSSLLDIQPVWMMNPLTVSENLPCFKDLFDVVIFDESSQIPLEDAIPAIHRAKQVVVVGDSKQMPPSTFFSSKEDTKTILDQAGNVYHNAMLKWHYRSKHPDLIRFSNDEFYNSELITLPPSFNEKPIELIKLEGSYSDGVNSDEAEAIGTYVKHIKNGTAQRVLIIAFSQEQEKAIQKALKKHGLELGEHLLTRNLENAQGIEADLVIVSIGYGKNKEGLFRLNFGPVNKLNGANRLNVLFTRAIQKMVVFSAVSSTDFGFSDNKGVQVLKNFLHYIEHLKPIQGDELSKPLATQIIHDILSNNAIDFAYYPAGNGVGIGSFVSHKHHKVLLVDPGLGANDFEDVAGMTDVLSSKYKTIKIVLSLDLWMNFERIQTEVLDYFME